MIVNVEKYLTGKLEYERGIIIILQHENEEDKHTLEWFFNSKQSKCLTIYQNDGEYQSMAVSLCSAKGP